MLLDIRCQAEFQNFAELRSYVNKATLTEEGFVGLLPTRDSNHLSNIILSTLLENNLYPFCFETKSEGIKLMSLTHTHYGISLELAHVYKVDAYG